MFSTASVVGTAAAVLSAVWLFAVLPRLGRTQESFEAELDAAEVALDSGDRGAAESHAQRAADLADQLGARSAEARAALAALYRRIHDKS